MAEPVSINEVKEQLRLEPDDSDQDVLINGYISAAREHAEKVTGLILTRRSVIQSFDDFCRRLDLYAWPIVSIDSVTYRDSTGSAQTIAGTGPYAFVGRRPVRLVPALGLSWPQGDSIIVSMTAGYATPDDVPRTIRQAILLLVSHWFANREAGVIGQTVADLPFAFDALLRPHRLVSV